MGQFNCYICVDKFDDTKEIKSHLVNSHKIREKFDIIKCVVSRKCEKTFQTWSGFYKHVKTCIANEHQETVVGNHNSENDTQQQCDSSDKIPIYHQNSNHKHDNSFGNEKCENIEIFDHYQGYHSRMVQYFRKFSLEIESLPVAQNVKDCIFNLTKDVLNEYYEYNCGAISECKNLSDEQAVEVLKDAQYQFVSEIRKYDTTFKRNKLCEENSLHVKPEEKAIGTHWETKKDRKTQKKYPVHVQSILQYVPITETLKSLFQRDYFRKLYFDYNDDTTGNKHKCVPGVYTDYCCGEIYKNIRLFAEHPESIQIQIFTDGFEMCDGLKSKASLHSQTGFYFAIRNLPPELAFSMDNIHMVVLCNANDVNTLHTDYNNIWKLIVDDLKCLETIGIDVCEGVNLKGKFKFRHSHSLIYSNVRVHLLYALV